MAQQKLAALLATGLFVQKSITLDGSDYEHAESQPEMLGGLDIDYSDASLYEDDGMQLPDEKEFYTPEELRNILIGDLKAAYGVKR